MSDEFERWSIDLDHLSASSLNMFARCPEQFRIRYVIGQKTPPAVPLTLGTACHDAIEHNFKQKIETREDLPTREVLEYFHDVSVPKSIEKDGGDSEIDWGNTTGPDYMHETGGRMVEKYQQDAAPTVQPIAVESNYHIHIPGVALPVTGFIDVETDQTVIDVKTAGRKVGSHRKAGWILQGRIYMLMTNKPVHWHVVTKAKEAGVYTPTTDEGLAQAIEPAEQTEAIIRNLALAANKMMQTFGPDDPWPTSGISTEMYGGLSCGWCGFYHRCTAWGGDGYKGVSWK